MVKFESGGLYFSVINPTRRIVRVGNDTTIQNNAICGASKAELIIPRRVSFESVSYKVTEVGRYSFYEDQNIKSIRISANIEIIKEYGFFRLNNCESVIFERNSHLSIIETLGLYDFYYIKTVKFNGNCLHSIYETAIRYMIYELKNLTIPASVRYIEKNNIAGMTVLEDLYYCGDYQITGTEVFLSTHATFKTPDSLKIHTKSTYPYDYFAERKITNKDADQYCKQHQFTCLLNDQTKCLKNRQTFSTQLLFMISLIYS